MTGHDDHHHHHDHDHSELSETELRVRALETILTEKGYVDPAALDLLIETYETKVGPRNGARVVARACGTNRTRSPDGRRTGQGRGLVRSGAAGAERADISCRMGAPRLCADAGDGDARRLEYRHVALRPRGPAATAISWDELLPDL